MTTYARALVAEKMAEDEFQSNIIDLCRAFGLLHYHTRDARRSPAGFPDLVITGPGGVLFRELKTAAGKPTPEQIVWLEALREAGADAAVWRPDQWPDWIRNELSALRRKAVG